ncbi:MAG: ATP-grasp domain-containing protein [Pirellulales bacterium]
MTQPFNILMSSAGHRVERVKILRATLAALGLDGRIVATDISRLSAAMQAADVGEIAPRCTSPQFTAALLDVCRRHRVRLVVPGIDTELAVLAAAREQFAAEGITVLISSPETIAIGADKHQTHRWLVERGFPTVRQATAGEVCDNASAWPFPLIAKPVGGSASQGVAVVSSVDELRSHTRGGDFVVQSIARGAEYTVDVLVDRAGKCVCAIPRRRIEVRAGEVFKGATHRRHELIDVASRIAEALPGAYGPLNVQMFFDEAEGAIRVIEINPRFGGGFPLSWEAGGKFPQWIIEEMLGLPSTASGEAWRDGLLMLRHFDAVFVDAKSTDEASESASHGATAGSRSDGGGSRS